MSSRVELTVDEMVAMLERSSLPTLIVEGSDDAVVFRQLEDIYADQAVSVFPAGGRTAGLEIHDRVSRSDLVFVVDQDCWVFSNVPDVYSHERVVVTSGYSLENDAYIDGNFERLMDVSERGRFQEELDRVLDWFALAAWRFQQGEGVLLKIHPNVILDDNDKFEEYTELKDGEQYPVEFRALLAGNYMSLLRGKSLLPLLMRQLSYRGRSVRHHHLNLLAMTAINPGNNLRRMFAEITNALGLPAYPA